MGKLIIGILFICCFLFQCDFGVSDEIKINWEDLYTVTYNGNGNTGGNVPKDKNKYKVGKTVTVLGNTGNLVKKGYTFTGWNTKANGSGTTYISGNKFIVNTSNVKLCAQYLKCIKNMILIPSAGKEFQMGSKEGNEKPVHTIKFTYDFWMSKTEVTQKDYKELMGVNPSEFKGENRPVENVTWEDAVYYCNARSKKEGLTPCYNKKTWKCNFKADGYRLPTEAEWEYACRAGTTTEWYWGNYLDSAIVSKYAWYSLNSENRTHSVGKKIPNAFGLYDMSGNVWEWCNDTDGGYQEGVFVNPTGPDKGSIMIYRGGSWEQPVWYCRSTERDNVCSDVGYKDLGFRVVRGQIEK